MIFSMRKAVYLCFIFVFGLFTLTTLNSSYKNTSPKLHLLQWPNHSNLSISTIPNPFRKSIEPHLTQTNTAKLETSWYSSWNWLSPISSSVTHDENRLLPPSSSDRPPIYTYYDDNEWKNKVLNDTTAELDLVSAKNAILLTWRRAWWAKGFKPIILSSKEAINNPLFLKFQMKDISLDLKRQLYRWLAWESMGTGILCDYMLLPMAIYEDPLLVFLRRGNYPKLTRFENLGNGLFFGSKPDITAALNEVINNHDLHIAKDFVSAVMPDTFLVEPRHTALAYYNSMTIGEKYPRIVEKIRSDDIKGLIDLNKLMIAHLHSTWQNNFHEGIAVVKPLPNYMTVVIEPAFTIAKYLSGCPDSPLPSSCPPNFPLCKPCVASQPLKISTPSIYVNISSLYTIGIVPHPYTIAMLASGAEDFDISWVRRKSERDPWLTALTKDLLGTGVSSSSRLTKFKDAVALDQGISRSLWLTAESPLPKDLDWYFGFTIPMNMNLEGKSQTPVPGPERQPKKEVDPRNGPVATEFDLEREKKLFRKIRDQSEAKISSQEMIIRKAIEAWNMADMEAWRFTRAFLAQKNIDRIR